MNTSPQQPTNPVTTFDRNRWLALAGPFPKGTTREDWAHYYDALQRHEERCQSKKATMNKVDWDMMHSCDAPNKPGYYRANND